VSASPSDPRAFTLPAPVRWLSSRLPAWPPAAALATLLNLALGRLIEVEALQPLCGKLLELRVTDAGLKLRLKFSGRAFAPAFGAQPADVVIGATAHDFYRLARRQADPDSLFFRRRLIMEGDTELALLVKNTLDSIDFAAVLALSPRAPKRTQARRW
jgi:predicted lipid carrier protein YhbT